MDMEHVLETLFDSSARVRILRVFLQNPAHCFTLEEIINRSRTRRHAAKKETAKLAKIGLLMGKKVAVRKEEMKRDKKGAIKISQQIAFCVNTEFWIFPQLRDLIIKAAAISQKKLLKRIRNLGNISLGVISGSLYNNSTDNSRIDLLVVGNNIQKAKLNKLLADVESELGKPIHYTIMDTSEFKYRMNMYDRFLRDIFEFPHQKLINKMKI